MIDTVVIFGDSYTYGHGCKDRMYYYDKKNKKTIGEKVPENNPSKYCWGSLLKKKYSNLKVYNFANPGRSNPHIFRDFLEYSNNTKINKKKHLVFFQLSGPNRMEVYDLENNIRSHVLSNLSMLHGPAERALKSYVKNIYHPSIGENISFMSLLGAYALVKLQQISYFYWSHLPEQYSCDNYNFLTSSQSLKTHLIKDIRELRGSAYLAPDGHTNEFGHSLYFKQVIDPMIKKHLNIKSSPKLPKRPRSPKALAKTNKH